MSALGFRFKFFLFFLVILGLAYFGYSTGGIQERNAYFGLQPLSYPISSIIVSFLWLIVCAVFMPKKMGRPSDAFFIFYIVFVALPGAVFWGVSGVQNPYFGLSLMVWVCLPLVLVALLRPMLSYIFAVKVGRISLFSYSKRPVVLVTFLAAAMIMGYLIAGHSGGFDWQFMYERRLSGREVFPVGSPSAYVFSMSVNGFAPFLAFYAGFHRKKQYFLIAILFEIFAFWLIGVKAPFLYVLLMYVFGRIALSKKIGAIHLFITKIYALVLLLAVIEYFFGGVFISEVFTRRATVAPPFLQGIYLRYIEETFINIWQWLVGVDVSGGISLHIGEYYMGLVGLNANTNAFLYALAEGGVVGFFTSVLFVAAFLSFLDRVYIKNSDAMCMALGALYSMLLTEQAYGTAFLSSGIFVGTVLFLLSSAGSGELVRRPVSKTLTDANYSKLI